MSNRFHSKYHRTNHHTYGSNNNPDSSHDPIASPDQPFLGDFVLSGALSATAPLSAYAIKAYSNNTGLLVTGGSVGIESRSTTGIPLSTFGEKNIMWGDLGININDPKTALHVVGDVTITGNLSTLGAITQLDTIVNVTSALTVNNIGTGPAIQAKQTGNQPVAVFYDDTIPVLFLDGRTPTPARVGIRTENPNRTLSVVGGLSASGGIEVGINNNVATSNAAIIGGSNNTVQPTGINSVILGGTDNLHAGPYSVILGGNTNKTTVTATRSVVLGQYGYATRENELVHSGGRFATAGDCQVINVILRGVTSTATPLNLALDGNTKYFVIPSNTILAGQINIVGIQTNGSTACHFMRKVAIKNIAGTTALVGLVTTIGADVSDDPVYNVSISANNSNDTLQITVTGKAATIIRWVAHVQLTQIGL